MQVSKFTSLLENPSQIVTEKHCSDLEEILENYPFFQAARGMHLLGLKNTNSYRYNAALKKHAAYTTDRSWLFEIITAEAFNDTEITTIKPSESLEKIESATSNTLHTPKTITEEKPENAVTKLPGTHKTENPLALGTPLVFGKNDRHSFEEWLSLTGSKTETPKSDKEKTGRLNTARPEKRSDEKEVKMAQIDAFLAHNPKIDAQKKPQEIIDMTPSIKLNKEALMTETLARVYLEQMKYKKALQAYKILSLKYPEKNSFFASQIKSIQKLIKDKS